MEHIEKQEYHDVTKFVISDEYGNSIHLDISINKKDGHRTACIFGWSIKHRTEGIEMQMIDTAIRIAKQEGCGSMIIMDIHPMDS